MTGENRLQTFCGSELFLLFGFRVQRLFESIRRITPIEQGLTGHEHVIGNCWLYPRGNISAPNGHWAEFNFQNVVCFTEASTNTNHQSFLTLFTFQQKTMNNDNSLGRLFTVLKLNFMSKMRNE